MAFSGFQNNAFQRNAFQILINGVIPPKLVSKGGIKKERSHNKSFRKSVKESLDNILAEPVAVEQVKEILTPYSNSNKLSINSIDLKLLSRNVKAAERLINLAMEMQREREDEEAIILML